MAPVQVSVIVPVYNTAEYLEQCLDSVLVQTFSEFEIIIINDFSSDSSAELINRYLHKDNRIRTAFHTVNRGLPEARNTGQAMAEGKYIVHLDSDDYWLDRDTLKTLFYTAEVDGCDILRFNGLRDNKGKLRHPIIKPVDIVNADFESCSEFWNYRSVFLYFFRADFLKKFNLEFVSELVIGEDAVFISRALPLASKISSISNLFYAYRLNDCGIMSRKWTLNDFLQEEAAFRVVAQNVSNVEGAHVALLSYRLSYYWIKRLAVRARSELTYEERLTLYAFVAETFSGFDLVKIQSGEYWTSSAGDVFKYLKNQKFQYLDQYIKKGAIVCHLKSLYIVQRIKSMVWLALKVYYRLLKDIRIQAKIQQYLRRGKPVARYFKNKERNTQYEFTLSTSEKPRGVSAMLRVKNEEVFIWRCLESMIEVFDEIVVIDNGSTDSTVNIVQQFQQEHSMGSKVVMYHYPFMISKCGEEHRKTDKNSLHSLVYFYNWCVSRCSYSVICKWDADMVLSSDLKLRQLFKDFVSKIVKHRCLIIGQFSIQTVYNDSNGTQFISNDEVHMEPRFFSNTSDIYFDKSELWEYLNCDVASYYRTLKVPTVYELKDVSQDEFSHWSSKVFTTGRKSIEYRNYMLIKCALQNEFKENFTPISGV